MVVKPRDSTGKCPKSPTGGHHWMIDGQDGPTSEGVCRYCDATRDFSNSMSTVSFTKPDKSKEVVN